MKENLMTLKQIQEKLQDRRLSVVGKATGLSYPTLKRLSDGNITNYALATLVKISEYLK